MLYTIIDLQTTIKHTIKRYELKDLRYLCVTPEKRTLDCDGEATTASALLK